MHGHVFDGFELACINMSLCLCYSVRAFMFVSFCAFVDLCFSMRLCVRLCLFILFVFVCVCVDSFVIVRFP